MTDSVTMAENLVLCKHPHAVFRDYDGETVVLLPSAETEAQVLNEVGGRIWVLVDGRRDVAAIVSRVADEFDVSPEQASEDVRAFLADLLDRGLLRTAS
jgi:hypothetical protein